MKAPLRRAPFVTVVAVASAAVTVAVGVAAAPTATAPLPARISSVTFTGVQAKPTITIRGHGFGTRPHPSPAYQPLGHPPLCPPTPTKPPAAYGFDYGTNLFLEDRTQQPVWSAGRYRPAQNELDCVGVIVVKFSPSLVVLRLGAFYTEAKLRLEPNDVFTIGVNAARFHSRVRYR
jgi:hypothetical protein